MAVVSDIVVRFMAVGSERVHRSMKNLTNSTKALSIGMRGLSQRLKESRGHMMGVGFGMLFLGMALKRAAEGALRSMATVYKEAVGNSNILLNTTNRLSAAFAFFKFSVIDALTTSDMFVSLLGTLIELVDWFSAMDESTKLALVGTLIIAAAIGTIAMVLGQISLLAMSLGVGLGFLLIVILVIVAAVFFLIKIWTSDMPILAKILWTIVVVLGVILVILMLIGAWPAVLIILIIALVVALVAIIVTKWDAIKEKGKELWQAFKDAFKSAWDWIVDKIMWLWNKLKEIGGKIKSFFTGNSGSTGAGVPEFQEGGFVPRTGPAILHAGEFVLSKKMLAGGGTGGGVNVGDINVSVLGETSDADRLAEMVSERVLAEFERYAHRGGV